MRTRATRRAALTSAATTFASIAILPRGVRAAGTTFKLGHDVAPTHPVGIRMQEFADSVKTATNGELAITVFPASQLGGDTQMFSQVRSGALQMYSAPGGVMAAVAPNIAITTLAYIFTDYNALYAAMDGDLGSFCRATIEKAGLVPMPSVWSNGFNQMFSTVRPIAAPADLVGFKVRTSASPIFVSTFNAFGAVPTPLNVSEAYTALQTRLVDGVTDPIAIIEYEKFYEVLRFASLMNNIWGSIWTVANQDAWNGLSKSGAGNCDAAQQRSGSERTRRYREDRREWPGASEHARDDCQQTRPRTVSQEATRRGFLRAVESEVRRRCVAHPREILGPDALAKRGRSSCVRCLSVPVQRASSEIVDSQVGDSMDPVGTCFPQARSEVRPLTLDLHASGAGCPSETLYKVSFVTMTYLLPDQPDPKALVACGQLARTESRSSLALFGTRSEAVGAIRAVVHSVDQRLGA